MQKIVFFDIDGTLVSKRNKIPKTTHRAIEELKRRGVIPVIATGRSPILLQDVAKRLKIDNYISMNGQYIVVEGKTIFHNPISKENIHQLSHFVYKEKDGILLCGDEEIFSNSRIDLSKGNSRMKALKRLNKIVPRRIQMSVIRRTMKKPPKPESYESSFIYQAILEAPESKEKIYEEAFAGLTFTRSNSYMFDVISKGTNKATGAERIMNHFGVAKENVYAFGDHLNDLDLLEFVGTGIAMGNAHPETKKVSKMVTDHVNKNGIENGLKKLKLIS